MDEALLELLKQADGYLSGAKIGEMLGVSRAAVWKGVSRLREQGYLVTAVTNKGYRILPGGDVLGVQEIADRLQTKWMGRKAVLLEEVDSTNLAAKRMAAEGAPEGTLILARRQTAGRGRMGRSWKSPEEGCIFMTVLLRPGLPPQSAPVLTLLVGMAVCKAVRQTTGLLAEIKWPNDVLLDGKKICGILTEMSAEMEEIHYVAAGIGINVNVPALPEEISKTATSLAIAGGKAYCRADVVAAVLLELEVLYERYLAEGSFSGFVREYEALCHTVGRKVAVIGRETREGTAVGVCETGELLVELSSGGILAVNSGEVSVRASEEEKGF